MKSREELEHDLVVVKMRLESAGNEIQRLVGIIKLLHADLDKERAMIKQYEMQKAINDSIIQQEMNRSNEESNKSLERIDFLTKKLREYGYFD